MRVAFGTDGAALFSALNLGSAHGESGHIRSMALLWGLVRTVFLFFAVIVAALVVLDGTLLANLLGKKE